MKKITLWLFLLCAFVTGGYAQVNSYSFLASTGSALNDMTGSTQLIGSGVDDTASAVTAIGFTFNYAGTDYTQFSVNPNGLVRLGATVVSTAFTNSAANANTNTPAIMPYWDDLATGSAAGGGQVHYVVSGTAPNRTLTIEWFVTIPRATAGAANSRFQCVLEETSNKVYFKYGTMGTASSASVGLATSTTVYNTVTTSTNTNSTATFVTNNTIAVPSGTMYTWSPPSCSAPSGIAATNITTTSADISWGVPSPVPSNGYEYVVSTVNTTPVGAGTASAGTSVSVSSLSPSTNYYVFVRSNCGGTFSNWSSVYNFATACATVSLPWTENFDALATGTNIFPICWAYENTASTWSISTAPTAHSGANSLRRTWSTDGWAFTPMATLTAGTSYTFSYWVRTNDATVGYDITVGVGNAQNSGAMTTTVNSVTGYQGASWVKVDHLFTPSTTGDYSFGVHVVAPVAPNGINFDDFRLELTPACLAPTGLAAANITATTADLSWGTVAGAVGYEYVVDTVATDPAGAGTATTGTTYNATGLSGSTTYYLHVRTDCGGTFSSWSTISFVTLMANDNLAGALPVACAGTYTGNTSTATLDEDTAPDGFGCNLDGKNVWYSYTGTGSAESITLDLCASSFDTQVMVYTGTSGALTLVAGNDDEATCGTRSKVTFTSDGSTTYYISIDGYLTASGAYSMSVTCAPACTPAVPNQTCATALSVNVDGSTTNSDNSCGDVSAVQPSCDSFGVIQDVWFSFVAPASGAADVNFTPTTMTSGNFVVLDGCGGVEVAGSCNSNLTALTTEVLTGLTAGNTYYIQVWSSGAEQGTFALSVSQSCAVPTGVTATNITQTSADLSWTATSGTYEYVLDQVATNPGGAGTALTGEAYSATGLSSGTQYYFHVRTDCGAGLFSNWVTYTFTTLAPPPANDDCAGATVLTVGVDFATSAITSSLVGATSSEVADPSIPAPGCASYIGNDVWFDVTVPATGGITIETGNAASSAITDTGVAVYTGACGALVLADCDDSSSANVGDHALITLNASSVPAVNPGDVLKVRVWRWNSTSVTKDVNAVGEFQIAAYDPALKSQSFDMSGFNMYPNPVKDELSISYNKQIQNVEIHNLLGQKVIETKVNALQASVNTSQLARGTYLVKVVTEAGSNTFKVIKE